MSTTENYNLDNIFKELKPFGKYQLRYYILLVFPVLICGCFTFSFVFVALIPKYRCLVPECDMENNEIYAAPWVKFAIPDSDSLQNCFRYKANFNTVIANNSNCLVNLFNQSSIEKCDKFVLNTKYTSIVNDFNLYCDENLWKVTLVGTVRSIGQFFSTGTIGVFSDMFSRKNILSIVLLSGMCISLIKTLATEYYMFIVLEFFETLMNGATFPIVFVLGCEFVSTSKRSLIALMLTITFSMGEALAALVAWNVGSWQHFIFITYLPIILSISYFWIFPESIRWLLVKKKYEEAETLINKTAAVNKITLSENAVQYLEGLRTNKIEYCHHTPTLKTLQKGITNPKIFIRLLGACFIFMSNAFIFYGIAIHSVTLAGNVYVNFMAIFLIDIPGLILGYFSVNKFGRRWTLFTSLSIVSLSCFGFILLPKDMVVLQFVLYLISKCGIAVSFQTTYIYCTELFPTPIRQSFLGFSSMMGRIGVIFAPQLPHLAKIWEPLPLIFFGAIAMVSALVTLIFPETKEKRLPDTIEETINIERK